MYSCNLVSCIIFNKEYTRHICYIISTITREHYIVKELIFIVVSDWNHKYAINGGEQNSLKQVSKQNEKWTEQVRNFK